MKFAAMNDVNADVHRSVPCFAITSFSVNSDGPIYQPIRKPGQSIFENVLIYITRFSVSIEYSDGSSSPVKRSSRYGLSSIMSRSYLDAISSTFLRRSTESVIPDGFWKSGMRYTNFGFRPARQSVR